MKLHYGRMLSDRLDQVHGLSRSRRQVAPAIAKIDAPKARRHVEKHTPGLMTDLASFPTAEDLPAPAFDLRDRRHCVEQASPVALDHVVDRQLLHALYSFNPVCV